MIARCYDCLCNQGPCSTFRICQEESVKVVEFAQGLGAQVTAEVAPQHFSKTEALLLTKEAMPK